MWHLTHPVGCPGYVKPVDLAVNDSAPTACRNLTLPLVINQSFIDYKKVPVRNFVFN